MKLTETDEKILKSYDTIVDGLAEYLGNSCEIVLHSLENLNQSVIKIVNGHHTGRKVGAPITNLALEMLNKIKQHEHKTSISYFTKNKQGEPLKSATIAIRGEKGRIIGLVCINFHLNTPLINFLSVFTYSGEMEADSHKEIFSDNRSDMMEEAMSRAKQVVFLDNTVLPSLKNRKIIQILHDEGIFNMKNSVEFVANQLDISKNTVYMHIRYIKKNSNHHIEAES